MYITRFSRKDGREEDYFFLSLFIEDNSELYNSISVIRVVEEQTVITLSFTDHESDKTEPQIRPLRVCEHCLRGIESKEGKQYVAKIPIDDSSGEDGTCEWCGDSELETCNLKKSYKIQNASKAFGGAGLHIPLKCTFSQPSLRLKPR